ncbi:tautomerase family protein [Deinococcus hopiensis]|uniref:Tautomerase n=1 Tax=Deinococcus hopiensis KR-140 TaxID=695939 RepID=A0A1W1UYH1_9DEIO|nr:4-oxalocrotonate tautomerase family protein [Deinococcus hopiensis]SMB86138.1 4-oxalocrotonate tautomerase [Deinococcus hopiensis KR-140]
MPYVKVEITRDGTTQAQKEALIQAITDALSDILGKDPEKTFVTIAEINLTDWGIGGQSIAARRTPS